MNSKIIIGCIFSLLLFYQQVSFGMIVTTASKKISSMAPISKKKVIKRYYRNDRNRQSIHLSFKQPALKNDQFLKKQLRKKNERSMQDESELVKKVYGKKEIVHYQSPEKSKKIIYQHNSDQKNQNQDQIKELLSGQDIKFLLLDQKKEQSKHDDYSNNRHGKFHESSSHEEPPMWMKRLIMGGIIGSGYFLFQDSYDQLEKIEKTVKNKAKQGTFKYVAKVLSEKAGKDLTVVAKEDLFFDILLTVYKENSLRLLIEKNKPFSDTQEKEITNKIAYLIEPYIAKRMPKKLIGTSFAKQLTKNYAQSFFDVITRTEKGFDVLDKIDTVITKNITASKTFLFDWSTLAASLTAGNFTVLLLNPSMSSTMKMLQNYTTKNLLWVPTVRFIGCLGMFDFGLHGINKMMELQKDSNAPENSSSKLSGKFKYVGSKWLLDTLIYYQSDVYEEFLWFEELSLNCFINLLFERKNNAMQDAKEILKIIDKELIPFAQNEKSVKQRAIESVFALLLENTTREKKEIRNRILQRKSFQRLAKEHREQNQEKQL